MILPEVETRKPAHSVQLNKISRALKRTLRLQLSDLIAELDDAEAKHMVQKITAAPPSTGFDKAAHAS